MKKKTLLEYSDVLRVLNLSKTESERDKLAKFIIEEFASIGTSPRQKRMDALYDIIQTHGIELCENLMLEYLETNSSKRRVEIRHGEKAKQQYIARLKNRPRPKNIKNQWTIQYWLDLGYDIETAKKKVSEEQTKNVYKRTKSSYLNHANKIKHSTKYWTSRGYTKDEANLLRLPYLKEMEGSLSRFISKYGEIEGTIKFHKRQKQRLETINERRNLGFYKTAGYVSKESLKFFIPLYKRLRRAGLNRSDIYFGLDGSREFFIRCDKQKNTGRFFDFTVPKSNICIEYNGTFWHPREKSEWCNPFIEYDDAMEIEKERNILCESRGFKLIRIWSDDNLDEKLDECFNEIMETYNG